MATAANLKQPRQRELAVFAVVEGRKKALSLPLVPLRKIESCTCITDAINVCIDLSGKTQTAIAKEIGLNKGHMSRICQGVASIPDCRFFQFMQACGNCAPFQYMAFRLGLDLAEYQQQ